MPQAPLPPGHQLAGRERRGQPGHRVPGGATIEADARNAGWNQGWPRTGRSERMLIARVSGPGDLMAGGPGWLTELVAPQATCQITIRTASWLSGESLWYRLAHANGQARWLSLQEHASGGDQELFLISAVRR